MLSNFISTHGVLISGAILLIAYIFIATEKIQKSVVALVGASLTMLLGLLPFKGYVNRETGSYVKAVFDYIEFDVIFLLIGMMIIVHIASKSGVFKWMAIKLLKFTKGHPKKVLFTLVGGETEYGAPGVEVYLLFLIVAFMHCDSPQLSTVAFCMSYVAL